MIDVTIEIRTEDPPDQATVLLHLGAAGDRGLSVKRSNVIRQHDRWIGLLDERGRFALSAYALDGVDEEAVLRHMPHTRYARSTVGAVRDGGFEMLPTSIFLPRMSEAVRDLQRFHYSIVLPTPGRPEALLENDEVDHHDLAAAVVEDLRRLLSLFEVELENWATPAGDKSPLD